MASSKRIIPTFGRRAFCQIGKRLPVPTASRKIESHSRSDVKSIDNRKQNDSGYDKAGENDPVPATSRWPCHDCETKQQRKCGGEDLSFKEEGECADCDSGQYPGTASQIGRAHV